MRLRFLPHWPQYPIAIFPSDVGPDSGHSGHQRRFFGGEHLVDVQQDFYALSHLGHAQDIFRIKLNTKRRRVFDIPMP